MTEANNESTPSPAVPDVAGAIAMLSEGGEPSEEATPEAAPAKPAEKPAETKQEPAETPAEAAKRTNWKELAKQKRDERMRKEAERAEQNPFEKERSELEELRAMRAKLQEQQSAFERDPLDWYAKQGHDPRKIYERATKLALDAEKVKAGDEAGSLREELKQLKSMLEESQQTEQQRRQAEHLDRLKGQFTQLSEDVEKYPFLSALDPEERLEYADKVAAELHAVGERVDLPTLARYVDDGLAELAERLSARKQSSGGDAALTKSPEAVDRRKGSTKTLTNAKASESTTAHEPASMHERKAEAARMIQGIFRST